jgi:hypothetical protein
MLTDFRQQLARAVRFWHVFITASRPCLLLFATERIGGDRDDRDRPQRRIGLDPPRRLVTVYARQLDIHKDKIGPLFRNGFERLLSALGLCDFVVGSGKSRMIWRLSSWSSTTRIRLLMPWPPDAQREPGS